MSRTISFDDLHSIAGYVGNGSSVKVSYCQDDATRGWVVTVGDPLKGESFHADTLSEAFAQAFAATKQIFE